jgi:hypothetical protein
MRNVRLAVFALIGIAASLTGCAAGVQGGASGDVRVRPYEGASRAQQDDFEALRRDYVEVFRLFGRAQACGVPFQERMKQVSDELEHRHGPLNQQAGMTIGIGLYVGMENQPNPFDKPGTSPPTLIPCAEIGDRLRTLRLPDVPASLVMRPDDPPETVKWDETASTGPFRVAVRMRPDGSGPARHVVVYRDEEVFESPDEIDGHRLVEGPTPVLLIETKHPRRRCADGSPYTEWHALTLPSAGGSSSAELPVDCTRPRIYGGAGRHDPRVCFVGEQGQSQVFGVDAAGNLHRRTPDPVDARSCPNLPAPAGIFLK